MDDRLPCPRCGGSIDSDLYGPCPSCITELRANQRNDPRATESAAFEPRMHVTPNAVASKE